MHCNPDSGKPRRDVRELLLDVRAGTSVSLASWLEMGGNATLIAYGASPEEITALDPVLSGSSGFP